MKELAIQGLCLVAGAELLAVLLRITPYALWIGGAALVVLLLALRRLVGSGNQADQGESDSADLGESLRHWLTGTETLIHWSESTRRDWDRHLRPILARRFEMTTGQRRAKNADEFEATGKMMFGADLWCWVDPTDVAQTGGREPGPGRATLEEILARLEQG